MGTRDFSGRRLAIIRPMTITIKTAADLEGMRIAGRLASEVLDMLTAHVKPGVTTERARPAGARPHRARAAGHAGAAELRAAGLPPYPKSICTSINHQVCHGIPNDRPLKNGDIVNIDVTVIKDGWHGDTSRMFIVGEGSIAAKRLCALTYEAMWKGIVKVKPGARLGDIGHAIQTFAENQGFSVVREFCGHGIGRKFHEEPQVLHYGRPGTLEELVPGMVFTIEPMINAGRREIRELGDGWTIVTKDRSLSAQWEHTVARHRHRLRSAHAVGRQPAAARGHDRGQHGLTPCRRSSSSSRKPTASATLRGRFRDGKAALLEALSHGAARACRRRCSSCAR